MDAWSQSKVLIQRCCCREQKLNPCFPRFQRALSFTTTEIRIRSQILESKIASLPSARISSRLDDVQKPPSNLPRSRCRGELPPHPPHCGGCVHKKPFQEPNCGIVHSTYDLVLGPLPNSQRAESEYCHGLRRGMSWAYSAWYTCCAKRGMASTAWFTSLSR